MENPSQKIKNIIKRVSEIIWWNRGLTKLNKPKFFTNFKEFINEKLIDIKGPYLEFILPPKMFENDTKSFLDNLGFAQIVVDTIIKVLFKGKNLYLYEHQAQTIKKIVEEKKDVILSVPTATGKTEAFLIPILDYCVKNRELGLKALIIYPMKTLEVDQLNRFIKYLYHLNNSLEGRDSIKIGIWDGDTPNQVGDPNYSPNSIPSDSYYRGIICPICKSKLRINLSGFLYCEKHGSFTWIMVTRENITNSNVDILISNPESLDFLMISPNDDRKRVIGSYASQYPLKYIVFDEIHIWTGLSGAAIKLFIERLRVFFKESNPQLIFLSATVKDPEKLISSYTNSKNYAEIGFTPIELEEKFSPDFNRLRPCDFKDLVYVLCVIKNNQTKIEDLKKYLPNLDNTIETLKLLKIIRVVNKHEIEILDKEFAAFFNINLKDVLEDPSEFEYYLSELLENYVFKENWRNIIINNLPEVISLINFTSITVENPIKFIKLTELRDLIISKGVSKDRADSIISMCLNFGRIADLLTDRYHIFLKPRDQLYWCKKCLKLNEKEFCECGNEVKILKFCRHCHEVFYESVDEHGAIADGTDSYPYSGNSKKCPNCGKTLRRFYTLGVPYTTFISFLISAVCRQLESEKIIIFSDGRGSAEKIGNNIIENDYRIVAEQLLLKILLDSGGFSNTRDIFSKLITKLNEFYYNIFKDESLDSISEDILEEYRKQNINPLANISNMFYSIEDSLITAKCITQLQNNADLILAHEILKTFTSQYRNLKFTKNKITFTLRNKAGMTIERIIKRFKKKFNFNDSLIEQWVPSIIQLFAENNIISEFSPEEIDTLIQRQRTRDGKNIEERKIEEVKDYLKLEKEKFQRFLIENNSDYVCKTGVFTRTYLDDFDVMLVEKVVFCKKCYASYPIINESLNNCPLCNNTDLIFGSRITKNQSDGDIYFDGLGYLNIITDWDFHIDHWASDILAYSINSDNKKIQRVSIAVHRAGLPYSLRGIFEEGFRKSPPSINAISSTPTLELGIDIGSLDAISMVGIPPLLTNYVQRAGRTGRIMGKPSFIFNIIRNNHSIDNYYFSELASYFKEFKPIFIPDPLEFDSLYAAHVINIICIYLARNPDPRNIYFTFFRLPEEHLNIKVYYKEVIKRIKYFMRLVISEKKSEIEKLIRDNYGEHANTIFNRMFFNENDDLYLLKIADRFFGRLKKIDADQTAVKSLTDIYRSLDWWFSLLGLIANYRGAGGINIPIYIPGVKSRDKKVEIKELDRAIRETYPGPENQQGALFRVETARYIVDDVHGTSEKLIDAPIRTCTNVDCSCSFIPYLGDSEKCNFCDSTLEDFTVYGLNTVKVKPARKWGDHFETSPFTLVNPELFQVKSELQHKFFNLNANYQYGRMKVVKSTLAFNKKYRTGTEPKLLPSEAFIESVREDDDDDDFDPLSLEIESEIDWDKEIDKTKPTYHPIGLNFQTLGLRIRINISDLQERINEYRREDLEKGLKKTGELPNYLLIALFSIQQAFKKMVSVFSESDMNDFDVCFTIYDDKIDFYLLDNREGGNGISKRVYEALIKDHQIYLILEKGILNCEQCIHYCDNCLLIERTLEFYVKKNLLDRILLNIIYFGKLPTDKERAGFPDITSVKEELESYWKNIIEQGESKTMELKSSLRWDYKQNKINKDLEFVVAKTISALLNAEGGKLFIGVDDDGKILGIENDCSTLSKNNRDGFLLKLGQVINNFLGKEFNHYLIINIVEMEKKSVCIVEVSKSEVPVFIKRGNQEEFYIRGAAGSQTLSMKETMEYIELHWPKGK